MDYYLVAFEHWRNDLLIAILLVAGVIYLLWRLRREGWPGERVREGFVSSGSKSHRRPGQGKSNTNLVSIHKCKECGGKFTVNPPNPNFGDYCLDVLCPSYDWDRDPNYLFKAEDEIREA